MRVSILAAVLALVTPGSPAVAQTPPEGLVWMVLRDINDYGFDRDDPTNRPPLVTRIPEGMITAIDVTRDGRTDWLVDYSESGINGYCGTGGCSKIVYVTLGDDGLTRAFDEQAHELAFYQAAGESRVEAWVHHSFCSGDASRECRRAYAWDADQRRLVERPNRAGETLISVGAFKPIDTSADTVADQNAPGPVADRWFKTRRTCPTPYNDDGSETRRAELHDIPDVDGDGVRDWIVEPPAECQAQPGGDVVYPGFEVWLTRAGGEAVQAYVSPADRYPHLDIARSPAVVVTQPPCGLGETCPTTRLRRDAGSGRLIE